MGQGWAVTVQGNLAQPSQYPCGYPYFRHHSDRSVLWPTLAFSLAPIPVKPAKSRK
ncbi:hypothetical protein KQS06HV_91433 [Klebsiella quasipneumoniae subsp. similipneumoniae]|nr:hypothetical protein SB30_420011 [Klebsiella quasipneumoniae subsp. similipneumoniae]SBA02222.1 hypothetical protein KQS06HV_91433 [Klebsiella quasipneumoniae subsp. similipneumoniae]